MKTFLTIIMMLTFASGALAQGSSFNRQSIVTGGQAEIFSIVFYLQLRPWSNTPDVSCESVEFTLEIAEPTGIVPSQKIKVGLNADKRFERVDVPFAYFGGTTLLVGVRGMQVRGACAEKLLIDSVLRNPDGSTAAAVGSVESIRAAVAAYAADSVGQQ